MSRVERGIYWRGGVLWIRYGDGSGGQRRETTNSGSIQKARALLGRRRAQARLDELPEKVDPVAFETLAAEYHRYARRHKSYHRHERYLIDLLSRRFGSLALHHLTPRRLERYQTSLLEEGAKPSTVNTHIMTIRAMLRKAGDWGLVAGKVYQAARKVGNLPERNKRHRFLTTEEIERLLTASQEPLRTIVLVALYTGIRKGKILSLRWRDVDFSANLITVRSPKNDRDRKVPLAPILRQALRPLRGLPDGWVFPSRKKAGHLFTIQKWWRKAVEKAGLDDVRFHDLRHTFASHLVMNGHPLPSVAELLGHTNLNMTMRYAHLAPREKAQAVASLYRKERENEPTRHQCTP